MTSAELKHRIEIHSGSSFWLQKAVNHAERRDAIDALSDAETLLRYCQLRAIESGMSRDLVMRTDQV